MLLSQLIPSNVVESPLAPINNYKSIDTTFSAVISDVESTTTTVYRPIILWHGLGDNYNSTGIHNVYDIVDRLYPGIFLHSIYINEDPNKDEQNSFFGDANNQVDQVCRQLSGIPQLSQADSVDAIGFSQGGVLLRGLVERCPQIKIHNLVTFGSPHMGVMEMPLCKNDRDWLCKRRNELLKRQVWYENVQKTILPAQYFRDPYNIDKYLEHSHYLADINNERNEKNASYIENLASLNKLILVTFTKDTTVVPKESAMFCDTDPILEQTIPFDKTELYVNDYIGLKKLHGKNAVEFLTIEDGHMSISEEFIVDVASKYFGV
ncbi:hypothetical protein PVL30_001908 [Lodderomyces elongisporus]|uniref:uncharacterized protein n=1 Tax=Lodderomyces elongisporus TaxID=36914 RepID=UPI0029212495|nr:uncharacterized protein PVL30_001908 [Lodderomyces elongisporus]WLF78179.1 hypothetical protein PVL30_001908 [Lodderomyces elongisporus]